MLDVLIRGGRLADGTGNPIHPADVGLEGDRIVAVERLDGAAARGYLDVRHPPYSRIPLQAPLVSFVAVPSSKSTFCCMQAVHCKACSGSLICPV